MGAPIYIAVGSEFAMVDLDDCALVLRYSWSLIFRRYTFYAVTIANGRTTEMHRLILPGPGFVDHRDGNGLNNTRGNIRRATRSQNAQNMGSANSNSGFKGVHLDRRAQRFIVKIKTPERRLTVGRFDDATEAARAYDDAARVHFGEFARVNFPREGEIGVRKK